MSLQSRFSQALLDPQRPIPVEAVAWNHSDPQTRFAVYRNNVTQALAEALAATFPVTQALVGAAFFHALAVEFARCEPPRSPVMAHYGATFADFIARFPPADPLPYLADVARLEYLYVQAFHAADAAPLTSAALQRALNDIHSLPGLRARLHPSARLLSSRYAAVSLWAAHQGTQTAERLHQLDTGQAEQALILRQGLEVCVIPLNAADYRFIELLQRGARLGQALELCAAHHPGFEPGHALALLTAHQGLCALIPATHANDRRHRP